MEVLLGGGHGRNGWHVVILLSKRNLDRIRPHHKLQTPLFLDSVAATIRSLAATSIGAL
jgi:hypothetical protein